MRAIIVQSRGKEGALRPPAKCRWSNAIDICRGSKWLSHAMPKYFCLPSSIQSLDIQPHVSLPLRLGANLFTPWFQWHLATFQPKKNTWCQFNFIDSWFSTAVQYLKKMTLEAFFYMFWLFWINTARINKSNIWILRCCNSLFLMRSQQLADRGTGSNEVALQWPSLHLQQRAPNLCVDTRACTKICWKKNKKMFEYKKANTTKPTSCTIIQISVNPLNFI